MVMMLEPLRDTITAVQKAGSESAAGTLAKKRTIYLTPQGRQLDQKVVLDLAQYQQLILIAGRYEGIDERVLQLGLIDDEISIGDYVLSGGELAAMVLIDTITRTLPNALGDADSASQDSFSTELLDYPHYTRPENIANMDVPKVLLSGNHKEIERWRLKQALGRTYLRRPDLLQKRKLTENEIMLLNEFISETNN
jgi:tRNA (guanine37-N1)-methyltransferase